MNIEKLFDKYNKENPDLMAYIMNKTLDKYSNNEWDIDIKGLSRNVTFVLLYEYATAIEKLTNGQYNSKQVLIKLFNNVGKLRFGDFIPGFDDKVTYDGLSATSNDYKIHCRIKDKFGAHRLGYTDSKGESKSAIVLFDKNQTASIEGKEYNLSGIDLSDVRDIRQTLFHEWTHVLERCLIRSGKLTKDDIVFVNGNSRYINSSIGPTLKKHDYEDYINNIDNILKTDTYIPFNGISTIELNDKKDPNRRIMHNQISEGATEFITRMILKTLNYRPKEKGRYLTQVRLVGDVFKSYGLSNTISDYFTAPYKIIRKLESRMFEEKDCLHYLSDFINAPKKHQRNNGITIDSKGNIKKTIRNKMYSFYKDLFNKNKTLPVQTTTVEDAKTNEFIDRLKNLSEPNNNQKYIDNKPTQTISKDDDIPNL